MKKYSKDILKFILFSGIGASILYFFYSNFDKGFREEQIADKVPLDQQLSLADKILVDLQSFNWMILVLAGSIFVLSNVFRAARWNQLLRSIGYQPSFGNSFWSVSLAYFVNLAIPRLGEFTRAGVMARNENIPVETLMGTIITDRLLDFVCLLIMFIIGFATEYDTLIGYLQQNASINIPYNTIFILIGIGVLGLGVVIYVLKTFNEHPIVVKVNDILQKFWIGIKSAKDVQNIPLFIFFSIAIWFCYYLMNYVLFKDFSPTQHLEPSNVLLVFLFSALGMVIPAPGGMGSYHALVTAGLMVLGISEQNGFSFAMISWAIINVGAIIPIGLLALIILPKLKKPQYENS